MKNELKSISKIEKNALISDAYFESLIEQALLKGVLEREEFERIQYECVNLLAFKVERFNLGESSSIPTDKAKAIMASNLFTLSLWLKTYEEPEEALRLLRKESIFELYKKGRKRIDRMVMSAKSLHAKLLEKLLETENEYYALTIDDGIKGFFKLYYPEFSAQEIHITADYPIYNPMERLSGIEFIKRYVECLYNENQFCINFNKEDIHFLLKGYDKGYKQLLINIYGEVLTAAIGCILSGENVRRLHISFQGVSYLNGIFKEATDRAVFSYLNDAFSELKETFGLSEGLSKYMEESIKIIYKRIIDAKRTDTWNIFYSPYFPENNPKIHFSFGNKMDNEKYRHILDEIIQCRFFEDKMSIIKKNVHSFGDLEDILLDGRWAYDEMTRIIKGLSLPEISALSNKYGVDKNIDEQELRDEEKLLRKCLLEFIYTFSEDQRKLILKAIESIQYEDS